MPNPSKIHCLAKTYWKWLVLADGLLRSHTESEQCKIAHEVPCCVTVLHNNPAAVSDKQGDALS